MEKLKFDKHRTQHRAPAGFIDAQTAVFAPAHIRDLGGQSTAYRVVCLKRTEVHDELTEDGNRHKLSKLLAGIKLYMCCLQSWGLITCHGLALRVKAVIRFDGFHP